MLKLIFTKLFTTNDPAGLNIFCLLSLYTKYLEPVYTKFIRPCLDFEPTIPRTWSALRHIPTQLIASLPHLTVQEKNAKQLFSQQLKTLSNIVFSQIQLKLNMMFHKDRFEK